MNSRLAGCTFIRPRQSLEEGLRTAVSFGFKSVDVGIGGLHGHISPIEAAAQPDELGERVRLATENAGVALNECFTLNFGYPLNDPAAARQQETRAHFAGLAKFAKKAGFASIMLLPGPAHPRLGASRSLELAVEAFKPLVDLAAKHGIALHVETDCDSCANAPETAAELCRRVQNLKLTLDYSHFISRGYLQEEIEPLHRYAGHVHVRQASRDHIVTRVERGSIDYKRVLNALLRSGYTGKFCVEYLACAEVVDAGIDCISETRRMAAVLEELLSSTLEKGTKQ